MRIIQAKKEQFFEFKNHYRSILLLIILIIISINAKAQSTGEIRTKITDSSSKAIEFVTNVLYKAQDSTLIKVVMSEPDGSVVLNGIQYGKYYLHTSFVGYKEKYTSIDHKQPQTNVPTIQLQGTVLEEVVVTSRKKIITRKMDRVVLNVGATLTGESGNLSDALKISPGVSVGSGGEVSLRGKSGVLILIDGRRSYLDGDDLENFISSMPANQFSSIEVMTNPPAKYDAEGNAGVINIITKRNYKQGWAVDLNSAYRQGRYGEIRNNVGWNLNSKKVSFFGNASYTNKEDFESYLIDRNFRDTNNAINSIFDQNTFIKRLNNLFSTRLGLDYKLSEDTTIGFLTSVQKTFGDSSTDNTTFLKNNLGDITQTLIGPALSKADYENFQGNVHFTSGDFSIDLDYLRFDSAVNQFFDNQFFNQNNNLTSQELLENNLPQVINIYSAKIDYELPLSEESKLEVGAKTSFVDTDNDAKFFEKIGGNLIEDKGLSNFFKYDENVNAGYVSYLQELGDFSFKAGLRVEQTKIEGNQVTQNVVFKNDYISYLPSAFLQYNLDEETQIGVSLGRRIERPDYRDLNPFRYFYDRFTFEEGNPSLNPEFTNNFELNYSMLDGAISASAYYNKTEDIITDVIFQNVAQNETFIKKDNLNDLLVYGLGVNVGLPITDTWTFTMNLDYSINSLQGIVNNNNFEIDVNTFSAFMLHQYKFAEDWSFEIAGWYTSKSLDDTFILEPYGRLSAAIGKNILDGRGKIRLSANDIFETNKFIGKSGFPNTDVRVNNTWQTQTIMLALTYKLGSGYNKKKEERESGIENQKERLNPYK